MVRLVDWAWTPELRTARLVLRFLHPDEATPRQLGKAVRSAVRKARRGLKSGGRFRLKATLLDLPGPLSRSTIELTFHALHPDADVARVGPVFADAFIHKLARKGHAARLEA